MAGPADDAAIREQAYYFWEQDGRPAGRENEYWQRAVMALTDKAQLDTLTELAPKKAAKAKASANEAPPPKKSAASKAKAAPAKAEAAKKPKKK